MQTTVGGAQAVQTAAMAVSDVEDDIVGAVGAIGLGSGGAGESGSVGRSPASGDSTGNEPEERSPGAVLSAGPAVRGADARHSTDCPVPGAAAARGTSTWATDAATPTVGKTMGWPTALCVVAATGS
ncbi:hypothetical protein SAMN05660657_02275 [Geodermatophilus amargosae]|uniref:Uncharacterized protein n=1 Tax=Geodermatophilus amargosae TaxID=1296565 RepID=A0A1I6ZVK3_9ACTN|nr:hypothetical protein [Geodermatophilus amargosae]SFT66713.1 hypothetical protein SAMN05660657_02275 [Geodermatophilus amargosae]